MSDEDPNLVHHGLGISLTLDFSGGDLLVTELSSTEPSTIFTRLPVRRPPEQSSVPRPNYFPTYAGLTPEQRWVYLSWLSDVSQPLDLGFVFLYYYGLERHMLTGELEAAFDEILLLRHHHSQGSFPVYSGSALLHACIARKRADLLRRLYIEEQIFAVGNTELRLLHEIGVDLSAHTLAELGLQLDGVNRRYIRDQRPFYEAVLEEVLAHRYGQPEFPFAGRFRVAQMPMRPDVLFANISFPSAVRAPNLPDFLHHVPFADEIRALLAEAHAQVKANFRSQRQRGRRKRLAPPNSAEDKC